MRPGQLKQGGLPAETGDRVKPCHQVLHLWDVTMREVIFASREASFTEAFLKL